MITRLLGNCEKKTCTKGASRGVVEELDKLHDFLVCVCVVAGFCGKKRLNACQKWEKLKMDQITMEIMVVPVIKPNNRHRSEKPQNQKMNERPDACAFWLIRFSARPTNYYNFCTEMRERKKERKAKVAHGNYGNLELSKDT